MLDPFVLRAILGILFASLSTPILVIMLLRGSLYITPEISHAALGGAALGVLIQTCFPALSDPFPTVILFCVATAIFVSYTGRGSQQSLGTMISVSLAISVTLYAVIRSCCLPADKRVLVDGYLISDLLLLSDAGVLNLAIASITATVITLIFYREFIYICFDMDAAEAFGLRVRMYDLLLFSTSAVAVAVITRAVGVLLSVTLLILPVAASSIITRNVGMMIISSLIIAMLSGIMGIALSLQFNMPTGGTIAISSTILFSLTYLTKLKKQ
ncbi:MAG: metal ABC transporter permease [Candidatus Bathyarchaeota archaeon]|nr:metal ABC transporter permease [Candidatus Bathyarchaeota archaeon]